MTEIKPEQVPRAAAIAATRDGLSSDDVRELVAAAFNAWEGMRLGKYRDVAGDNDRIILPLPQEASDDMV